jgi:hypothetical protein
LSKFQSRDSLASNYLRARPSEKDIQNRDPAQSAKTQRKAGLGIELTTMAADNKCEQCKCNVPITLRDFFWQDPFFSTNWDDFSSLHDQMIQVAILRVLILGHKVFQHFLPC